MLYGPKRSAVSFQSLFACSFLGRFAWSNFFLRCFGIEFDLNAGRYVFNPNFTCIWFLWSATLSLPFTHSGNIVIAAGRPRRRRCDQNCARVKPTDIITEYHLDTGHSSPDFIFYRAAHFSLVFFSQNVCVFCALRSVQTWRHHRSKSPLRAPGIKCLFSTAFLPVLRGWFRECAHLETAWFRLTASQSVLCPLPWLSSPPLARTCLISDSRFEWKWMGYSVVINEWERARQNYTVENCTDTGRTKHLSAPRATISLHAGCEHYTGNLIPCRLPDCLHSAE